jgi:hypothetical protein
MKLKEIQKQGVAVRALHANARVDPQLISSLLRSSTSDRPTGGRPTGSTIDASKTLDDRYRKACDDAANIFSELKTTSKLPRGGLKQIIERAKVENGLENE